MTVQVTETSPPFEINTLSKRAWQRKLGLIASEGKRKAEELRAAGRTFMVEILGPSEVREQSSTQLAAVTLDLNWTIAARLEMLEDGRNLINKAVMLDALDPALPAVLSAIIEGKGLFEQGIGEFFVLYGRFEQKYGTHGGKTRTKMERLLNGDTQHMRRYRHHGGEQLVPIPYAVRNILAHAGTNPNKLDPEGNELRQAIGLLREWVERTD